MIENPPLLGKNMVGHQVTEKQDEHKTISRTLLIRLSISVTQRIIFFSASTIYKKLKTKKFQKRERNCSKRHKD